MKVDVLFTLVLVAVGAPCYCMEMQQELVSQKKYVMCETSGQTTTKKWRASLSGLFDQEYLKNKKLVNTKFNTVSGAEERKKTFSLIPKPKYSSVDNALDKDSATPQALLALFEPRPQEMHDEPVVETEQTTQEYQRMLLKLSGKAGVIERCASPELEEVPVQVDPSESKRPSLSASQIMLARQVKIRRENYAKGRSGRDSQVKITAREYLGKKGEHALVCDSSEEAGSEEKTPCVEDYISPRNKGPRLDESIRE